MSGFLYLELIKVYLYGGRYHYLFIYIAEYYTTICIIIFYLFIHQSMIHALISPWGYYQ